MKFVTIKSVTSWKSLPWNSINQRIFALQEKIYIFSKQCKQKEVQKIQNSILSSSDAKILAIQIISRNFSKYYINDSKEKYYIKDIDKFYIYSCLFTNKIYSQKEQILIQYIKQYLIYLCLKPEWEARLEPLYKFNISNTNESYLLYKLSNFFFKKCKLKSSKKLIYSLNKKLINKYININKFVNKTQCLSTISYYIHTWLNEQYIIESLNIEFNNNYNQNKPIISCLERLIYNILYNGTEWYIKSVAIYSYNSLSIFQNLYLVFDNHKLLEMYINNFILFKNDLKNIKSIYDTIACYHYNISYCHEYKKQIKGCSNILIICQKYAINLLKHSKYTIQMCLPLYKYFIWYTKNLLYHYNLLKKWKPNKFKSFSKVLNILNSSTVDFCWKYYPLINLNNIKLLFVILNNILFKWIKKSDKKVQCLHTRCISSYNKIDNLLNTKTINR
ncbi:reverse transcriptase N-terminal domain-containing protein [Bacillus mycoides]|uniref:reverse transcriptase N-terminal domain-containing protein n=1 Tax=Bacillus mycoides TaxID=1405 RepID=UPI003D647FDD